ncbi:hypothetical protein F4808DRAFT_317059 [Astrocystis sublimbata]|nr:hypothetical protein F4808DRAFT_317059 [Astrocystis sublimbata]
MARNKKSSGKRMPQPNSRHQMQLRQEAERRARILANTRRIAAKWRPKIPEVRKCNFENFKNRFHDLDEKDYAIDVLMGGSTLQSQIRREQTTRRREKIAETRQNYLISMGFVEQPHQQSRRAGAAEEKARKDKRAEVSQTNDTQICRIRIQSQPVLGHLTLMLNDQEQRSAPRTFVRPFKPLIYFQPRMKEILATLEEKWADVEDLEESSPEKPDNVASDEGEFVEATDGQESVAEDDSQDENEDDEDDEDDDDDDDDDDYAESVASIDSNTEDQDGMMDSVEALRDMRCYVKFIDEEIMPLYNQFNGTTAERVKFDDLWSLFRVGDLINMPAGGETASRYHEMWRIYRVELPEQDAEYPDQWGDFIVDDDIGTKKKTTFNIFAYYIDHDGDEFGAVRHTFRIPVFPGERLIESLEVFPVRYRHDHQQLLASLVSRGRNFQKFLTDRHQSYNAWTLTRNPPLDDDNAEEEVLKNDKYEPMRHPEFVESDVIVDMAEAYQKNPDWRPSFHHLTPNKTGNIESSSDDMYIKHWLGGSRQSLAYKQMEVVQTEDGIEMRQRRENLNVDNFLKQRMKGSRRYENDAKAHELRDEDLVLLPKRMFAYALRERRFVPVSHVFLKPIRRQPGVFESLKILKDYKDIVRGLVASHFQRKALERRYVDMSTEGPSQDLIQNKGRGLVVLLHGVPGVGKTATAEAVAMEYKKPLFVITCGDLGLTPHEVEDSLSNVFRLAHLWDCVLLLDEADVFLAQRSKLDMKRNALVSVFLRVLEYYNGLLFLTTNRVGTIDDAFKSRIHMSLYYPPLDKIQTRDIFRLNINRLREIETQRTEMTGEPSLDIKESQILDFASKHFEENARSTGCWNGRQIRNAFQIASSLAHHNYTIQTESARELGQQPPRAPILDRDLFEKVQMSTTSFDRHMSDSKGFDGDLPLRSTFHQDSRFE